MCLFVLARLGFGFGQDVQQALRVVAEMRAGAPAAEAEVAPAQSKGVVALKRKLQERKSQ